MKKQILGIISLSLVLLLGLAIAITAKVGRDNFMKDVEAKITTNVESNVSTINWNNEDANLKEVNVRIKQGSNVVEEYKLSKEEIEEGTYSVTGTDEEYTVEAEFRGKGFYAHYSVNKKVEKQ